MKKTSRSSPGKIEFLESRTLMSAAPVPGKGTGLSGEYFAEAAMLTPIAMTPASTVNFNWAFGRPLKISNPTSYGAKFVGDIVAPATGDYTFYISSNQSARLFVNGIEILATEVGSGSEVATLSGGVKTSIEVDVFHTGPSDGPAHLQLLWSSNRFSKRLVPASVLYPADIALPTEPLTGYYFSGQSFNKLQLVEADSSINFNEANVADIRFPQGSPLSIRWIGSFTPSVTGVYTLLSNTDDGARVWIDGKQVIHAWYPQVSSDTHSVKLSLTAGQTYALRMDYYGNSQLPTTANLRWIVPGASHPTLVPFAANTTAPATAPTGVIATAVSSSEIDVTWNAVAGATNYQVLRSTGGQPFTLYGTTGGQTSLPDMTVSPGTTYSYEIIATNSAGASPASSPIAASTPTQSGVPGSPIIGGTATATTVTVIWSAVSGATSYLVERSSDGVTGWTSVGTTATTSLTDTNLANGTTYYYRVLASNSVGSGTPSNVAAVPTLPAAVTLTGSVASAMEIDLNWNDVTGETGFLVQESLDGHTFTPLNSFGSDTAASFPTVGQGVTSLQVGGLNPATMYYFKVTAEDASGGTDSNVISATTSAANPPHSSITEVYGLTGGGTVYAINTSNGAVSQIGSLSFGTNAGARDPISGNLYYISTGQTSVEVATWNPFDNINSLLNNNVPLGNPVAQAAFRDDGQMFLTTDMGQLFSINSISGVATFDGILTLGGSTLLTGNGDMAFGPDRTMYIETNSTLYSATNAAVNAANGGNSTIALTQIGATGTANLQIAFGQDGVLYGTSAAGQLYKLSTTTGAATAIGSSSGIAMGDLASTPLYGDLAVSQSSSAFVRGLAETYTINVTNNGPDSTVGPITLVDVLPTGVIPQSFPANGWTATQSGQTLTFTYVGNIAAGASAPTITLAVSVSSGAANSVSNTITASTTEFETSLSNNISTITTAVTG